MRATKQAAEDDHAAERAAAEAREAAARADRSRRAPWEEFGQDLWDPSWDRFHASSDIRHEGVGFVLERQSGPGSGGTYTVAHRSKPRPPAPPDAARDAALQGAVKERLSGSRDVCSEAIDVAVTDNVVLLQGTVGSGAEAREAVRSSLNTRGVFVVVSLVTVVK